jgi:hypothetical protein
MVRGWPVTCEPAHTRTTIHAKVNRPVGSAEESWPPGVAIRSSGWLSEVNSPSPRDHQGIEGKWPQVCRGRGPTRQRPGGVRCATSDSAIDGAISEVATRRSEFAAIIKNDGVDGLIAALNRKADMLTGTTARSF